MLVVLVYAHVTPDSVEAFIGATRDNARDSLGEPGVVRFDVIQEREDPTRFVLVEVYRGEDDPARHKLTAHYQRWRDLVEPMMAEPRKSTKYRAVAPPPAGWETPR